MRLYSHYICYKIHICYRYWNSLRLCSSVSHEKWGRPKRHYITCWLTSSHPNSEEKMWCYMSLLNLKLSISPVAEDPWFKFLSQAFIFPWFSLEMVCWPPGIAYIVLEMVSVLLILQEILTNLWEDLREVCSQVTFGWMAKNRNPFHDPVIIRKCAYMYPLVKGINTKSYYLQVRPHSAE